MGIKHAKQSGLPADGGVTSVVQPSDWYADHTGGVVVPTITQFKQSGTAATSLTLDSTPTSGHALLLLSDATTGQITSVASTNTTWTQLKTFTSGGGSFYALWVGIVAASASA